MNHNEDRVKEGEVEEDKEKRRSTKRKPKEFFSTPSKKKEKKKLDQIVSTKCVVARSQEHCAWNSFFFLINAWMMEFCSSSSDYQQDEEFSVPPAKGEGISFRLTNHTGNVIFEMAAIGVIYPFIQSLIAHLNYSDKIWSVLQALLTPSELGNENSIITR